MTAKIQHFKGKSKLNRGFCIDSFKLIVDQDIFTKVDIPHNFKVFDTDTGEITEEFKKNSIPVEYKNSRIYIAAYTKVLRGIEYSKLCLLFSSKPCSDYFSGIRENDIKNVLNFFKKTGKLDFDDVNTVYEEFRFKDLDIKQDLIFPFGSGDKIKEVNKRLKNYFVHNPERCNIARANIGLQANHRDNSSFTKPFIKFYDKQAELRKKHPDFYNSLDLDIRRDLSNTFVYRYEFTIKDKTYCDGLGITDKISDLMYLIENNQKKIQEIALYMYNANFGVPKMKPCKQGLSPSEMKDLYMFHRLHELGVSIDEIRDMYTRPYTTSKHRDRGIQQFNKIYAFATSVNDENKRIRDDVELMAQFFSYFNQDQVM
jgi:hypothetical protein